MLGRRSRWACPASSRSPTIPSSAAEPHRDRGPRACLTDSQGICAPRSAGSGLYLTVHVFLLPLSLQFSHPFPTLISRASTARRILPTVGSVSANLRRGPAPSRDPVRFYSRRRFRVGDTSWVAGTAPDHARDADPPSTPYDQARCFALQIIERAPRGAGAVPARTRRAAHTRIFVPHRTRESPLSVGPARPTGDAGFRAGRVPAT